MILCSPANPSYTADELVYQLEISRACLIFTHSEFLETAVTAAHRAGIPKDRVAVISGHESGENTLGTTVDVLISSAKSTAFKECKLKPGQAKTKVAFLSFSSGTTGRRLFCLTLPLHPKLAPIHPQVNQRPRSFHTTPSLPMSFKRQCTTTLATLLQVQHFYLVTLVWEVSVLIPLQ
jgi:acyl-CoA synthetase (AMP-forming)/AMP-acid ligase II